MTLPLPIEIRILTLRIPWPLHRLSSVRECVELSTQSHLSALVCQGGTSMRSCLSLQCLVIVKQPLQWDDPREQNSSPSHRCAAHMHQGHLHSLRCCIRKSKTFSDKLYMHIVSIGIYSIDCSSITLCYSKTLTNGRFHWTLVTSCCSWIL